MGACVWCCLSHLLDDGHEHGLALGTTGRRVGRLALDHLSTEMREERRVGQERGQEYYILSSASKTVPHNIMNQA